MIGLVLGFILILLSVWALRGEGVRWRFAIPLSMVPASFAFLGGIFGAVIGAMVTGAFFKMKLPA